MIEAFYMNKKDKIRCSWPGIDKPEYAHYHDTEWGVPVHEDHKHFEFLILEGAQAGLSWYTILKRRESYRTAFKNFDPQEVAKMTDSELESLIQGSDIIRNRLKIYGARKNAIAFIAIREEFGSFDKYIWRFVDDRPIVNYPRTLGDIPTTSPEAMALSKDLKKRGMTFVGATIMYAYMQAIGMVNDHIEDCFRKYV